MRQAGERIKPFRLILENCHQIWSLNPFNESGVILYVRRYCQLTPSRHSLYN